MIRITFTPQDDPRGGVDAEASNFVDCVVEFLSCFQLVYGPFDAVDALVPLFKTLAEVSESLGDNIYAEARHFEMGEEEQAFTLRIDRLPIPTEQA